MTELFPGFPGALPECRPCWKLFGRKQICLRLCRFVALDPRLPLSDIQLLFPCLLRIRVSKNSTTKRKPSGKPAQSFSEIQLLIGAKANYFSIWRGIYFFLLFRVFFPCFEKIRQPEEKTGKKLSTTFQDLFRL